MCLRTSPIRPYQKWNWTGSEIVHDTAIPVTRKLTRGNKVIKKFPVDIREFITIENNAVVKKEIDAIINSVDEEDRIKFYKKEEGNFDFRVRRCQEHLKNFQYTDSKSRFDEWRFPEETIKLRSGDCEDLAFLLASMILSCGVSDYCVRVVFGKVICYSGNKNTSEWEHAWVVYQNEKGVWEIVEPLLFVKQAAEKKKKRKRFSSEIQNQEFEYLPHYVFNRDHLWRVRTYDPAVRDNFNEYLVNERKYFNKFNPAFAASVHNTIFHEALKGMSSFDLQRVIATSLYIDVNTIAYDPRDHFDFACINEGWDRIKSRLATKKLSDFALAIHAIGDFYAHSYYGYFAINDATGKIPVYDPANPLPPATLKYDFSRLGKLPGCEMKKCNPGVATPEQVWNGKLISGQWWRWFASIPDDLQNQKDFCKRRCLPDHDAVAVDSPDFDPGKHKYCKTPGEYTKQFDARMAVAIEHIRMVYNQWKK